MAFTPFNVRGIQKQVKKNLSSLVEKMISAGEGDKVLFEQICFRGKKYEKVKGVFEWNAVEIQDKTYCVLRVSF